MLDTIWMLVVKNWRTTSIGVATAIVWLAGNFGFVIPEEVKLQLTAFLISLGLLFAKDGNQTGLKP